ncbi:MAG: hypothetical protein DSY80_05145 [Desulfocapsa sp.]|nr:MAG: hypothetical protein DSY80_05145 [Desulfocapsa sp.]
MSDHVHILITGDEGQGRSLLLSKRKIKGTVICIAALLFTFAVTSYSALYGIRTNANLSNQVAALHSKLSTLSSTLEKSATSNDALALQLNSLKEQNNTQEKLFRQEKATLLNTAVSELEERSAMIERIMCNIGVDIKDKAPADSSNSGGPFIIPQENVGKELLYRSDIYLETIHYVPLGRPVPGKVSSRYGHRTDPINGKRGFHTGVDLQGRSGEPILATADGVVRKALRNGGYGKYVEIDHGNGYVTKFAHMKKILVKRGEKVARGQQVGLLGNSGRSTGSHLHYEICFKGDPINPSKFMHTKTLNQVAAIKELNTDNKTKRILLAKTSQQAAAISKSN